MAQIFLIRHSAPLIEELVEPRHWILSPEGEAAARDFARSIPSPQGPLYTSPEPKAVRTARLIAEAWKTRVVPDPGLREVEGRPWMNGRVEYEVTAVRYLRGEPIEGWEDQGSAQARITTALSRIADSQREVVVVSHGLVLILALSSLLKCEPDILVPVWQSMRFPDLCIVDSKRNRVLRSFGQPVGQLI